MGNEIAILQNKLDSLEQEIHNKKYILSVLEKKYNIYGCIVTKDCKTFILSKRISYDKELKSIMEFTKIFIRKLQEMSYPIKDVLFNYRSWRIGIQTITSNFSDIPLLFIVFIPDNCQSYRHAIQWSIEKMAEHHN
ncbi:MAG: hypothetical protein ACFFD2_15465 [Promethearchaeota archaeon]